MALSLFVNLFYYGENAYCAVNQAYLAYTKAKMLKDNPNPGLKAYLDCGFSFVSAGLTTVSLGLSIRRDIASYQKQPLDHAAHSELKNLQEKENALKEAIERAKAEIKKKEMENENINKMLDEIWENKINLQSNPFTVDMPSLMYRAQHVCKRVIEVPTDFKYTLAPSAVNHAAHAQEGLEEISGLMEQLSDAFEEFHNAHQMYSRTQVERDRLVRVMESVQNTEKMFSMLNCMSYISEAALSNQPFSNATHNRNIIRSGLEVYVAYHPKSEIAKLLQNYSFGGKAVSGVSLATGWVMSRIAGIFQSENHSLPNEIPEELAEDPIFQERICPLSQSPIRYPMILFTDGREFCFEAEFILAWCARCESQNLPLSNPLTRTVFNRADLRPDIASQAVIESRLRELAQGQV